MKFTVRLPVFNHQAILPHPEERVVVKSMTPATPCWLELGNTRFPIEKSYDFSAYLEKDKDIPDRESYKIPEHHCGMLRTIQDIVIVRDYPELKFAGVQLGRVDHTCFLDATNQDYLFIDIETVDHNAMSSLPKGWHQFVVGGEQ